MVANPEVREVAKSNDTQANAVNAKVDLKVDLKVDANTDNGNDASIIDLGNNKKEASQVSTDIVENEEKINQVEMLNKIINAFKEDDKNNLAQLRSEYNYLTTQIMANYNEAIQKEINNNENNGESAENNDHRETSNSNSEERPWDWLDVATIYGNEQLAQDTADRAMRNQPERLLSQISDINYVLEKWSESDKAILKNTIAQEERYITELYHKVLNQENNQKRAA